jgi:hypothetical protein
MLRRESERKGQGRIHGSSVSQSHHSSGDDVVLVWMRRLTYPGVGIVLRIGRARAMSVLRGALIVAGRNHAVGAARHRHGRAREQVRWRRKRQ